ncbi:MAG: protein kinase [Thermodesulfobacteriota bacterium]|nr:protein kinase [Thermodesulfobacteriota bacterium]
MEINTLNEILNFIEAEHRISEKLDLPPSGQREVFLAENISTGDTCIAKICDTIPVNVARIQREIRILSGLDSKYFPKFYFQSFISRDIISNLFDSFDPRVEHEKKRIEELKNEKIYPFLITIEEFIEHVHWKDAIETIREEKNLVKLLIHLFQALSLLWQKKIVHRDLKPDNILLRKNLLPVIIDLGIAKSFRDGTQNLTHYLFGTPCTHQYAALEQLINSKTEITLSANKN